MKELRKEKQKQDEALKKLSTKHHAALAKLKQQQAAQAEMLQKDQELAESTAMKERRAETDKLQRANIASRKRHEEVFCLSRVSRAPPFSLCF